MEHGTCCSVCSGRGVSPVLGLGLIALALFWAFTLGLVIGALWGRRLGDGEAQEPSSLTFEERCKIEALEEMLND